MKLSVYAVLLALGSYLLGSVSASIVISNTRFGSDIRKYGSGNAGATNMARTYGLGEGVITLIADFLKALIATQAGSWLLGETGIVIGGLASLLGHCFPIFYIFKGGKGVSVGAAIALAVHWKVLLVIAAVFFIVALLTKKVSAGSVCAAVSLIVVVFLLDVTAPLRFMSVVTALLVIFQHRQNIRRLLNGTEPDFKAKQNRRG